MIALGTREIPLSNRDGVALVDDRPEVLAAVAGIRWSATRWGHVQGHAHGTTQFMHRLVWLAVRGPAPAMIDHIDRDPRNNRLGNLRAGSPALNARNSARAGIYPRGVRRQRFGGFQALVTIRGAAVGLGTFPTADEAGAVYAVAAARLLEIEADRAARGLAFASDEPAPPAGTAERRAWSSRWRTVLTAPVSEIVPPVPCCMEAPR